MDIQYLLWLQGLRGAWGPSVEEFFVIISAIAAKSTFVLIPLAIYWCLDKKKGLFVLTSIAGGQIVNQLLKSTFCIYRPWIRDSAVVPSAKALPEATGYSFPSGHTVMSGTFAGALGWCFRKISKVLFVLCWIFVLLVAFSRNFLGCHTPQDVIVGFAESILIIFAVSKISTYLEKNPEKDTLIFVIGLCIIVASMCYTLLKPYPMDYIDGELLVDPKEMSVDSFKLIGLFTGFLIGWFLERRLIRFDTKDITVKTRLIRLIIGVVCVVCVLLLNKKVIVLINHDVIVPFLQNFLSIFVGVFVAPAIFHKIRC